MRPQPPDVLARRLTELAREVGTLLLAFAPLDYALEPEAAAWSLGGFVFIGSALFGLSVYRETRNDS